jgi:hypothetical protein
MPFLTFGKSPNWIKGVAGWPFALSNHCSAFQIASTNENWSRRPRFFAYLLLCLPNLPPEHVPHRGSTYSKTSDWEAITPRPKTKFKVELAHMRIKLGLLSGNDETNHISINTTTTTTSICSSNIVLRAHGFAVGDRPCTIQQTPQESKPEVRPIPSRLAIDGSARNPSQTN